MIITHRKPLRHFDVICAVYPLTMLEWLAAPTHYCFANAELPDFSVQSDPGVTEEVEVKVEGTVEVACCVGGCACMWV